MLTDTKYLFNAVGSIPAACFLEWISYRSPSFFACLDLTFSKSALATPISVFPPF